MPTQEKDQMCENLVRKLMMGESLDDAEKIHLAGCESCLAEVVQKLDESGAEGSNGMTSGELNGDVTSTQPVAQKALEHGRRVFEREFGISLSPK